MTPALHYFKSYVAVVGLGRSGLSAARALEKVGAKVVVWDDDEGVCAYAEGEGFTVIQPSESAWAALKTVVWSPGIPLTHSAALLAGRLGIPIVCDVDLLCEAKQDARVIAVTGTNGKSTTVALIAHILESAGCPVAVGGNIGVPALDLPELDWRGTYVLELSSYQLEMVPHLKADIAVWLNISPDHLGRHGGLQGYIDAKEHIFQGHKPGAVDIIGIDDPESEKVYTKRQKNALQPVVPVSTGHAVTRGFFVTEGVLYDGRRKKPQAICDMQSFNQLPGVHNWQNIACAFAAAEVCGLSADRIVDAIKTFSGLPHRLEIVECIEGVPFINDSKATNPSATARALACYDSILWIAGGEPKDDDLSCLRLFFPRVRQAFLIGKAQDAFAQELEGKAPWVKCGSLQSAVERADELAEHGDVVLLSPACASFDQFRDFEHRGREFARIVQSLAEEEYEERLVEEETL
jgi:UDP-N-acetylmuramoylalanine--D-glutamate ligase